MQNRVSDGISLSDAVRHYRWHLALGGAMALAAALGMQAAVWMAPIFAGLLAAPLLVAWTSRADPPLLSIRLSQSGLKRSRPVLFGGDFAK